MKRQERKLLWKGVLYDLIGMASYAIPVVGPFFDILWAPFAAREMRQMYPGKKGKAAAILVFIEEILPGTDLIPSFSLMWLYTFVWSGKRAEKKRTIDVESF